MAGNGLKEQDDLMAVNDVCAYAKVSVTTLWRLRRNHDFPLPIALPGGRLRWRRDTVVTYFNSLSEVQA